MKGERLRACLLKDYNTCMLQIRVIRGMKVLSCFVD